MLWYNQMLKMDFVLVIAEDQVPFGRFRTAGESGWRIGVAIGDQVLDLRAAGLIDHADMHRLMQVTPQERQTLRQALSEGLRAGSTGQLAWEPVLLPQSAVELGLPCEVGDYTDFYAGIHHASEIGRQFRPDKSLLPNCKWVPIGYHGRASTLQASGSSFHRPMGQSRAPDAAQPVLAPCAWLDIELELGIFIGQPNAQGVPVSMQAAEQHVFGITLFNDWSARDIQAWEYQPLGPFLSKNFASTVWPWIFRQTMSTRNGGCVSSWPGVSRTSRCRVSAVAMSWRWVRRSPSAQWPAQSGS